jgi:NADH:ubiquinone oxidoreductase subunit 5 (subunit L)/multisubunit Na+/H+ antiporter MnhA subunit
MKASTIALRTGVCAALIGMMGGVAMGLSEDHALAPAHAHMNLVGWASLFLMGLYYRQSPALDCSRAAQIQILTFIVGGFAMVTGVALIYAGHPAFAPLAGVGSLVTLAGMLFFAYLVFRPEREVLAGAPAAAE